VARFQSRSTVWFTCTILQRIFEEPIPMHRLLEQVYRSEAWLRQIQQRMQRQRLLRLETMRIRQHSIHRQHRLTRAFLRTQQRLRIQALQIRQQIPERQQIPVRHRIRVHRLLPVHRLIPVHQLIPMREHLGARPLQRILQHQIHPTLHPHLQLHRLAAIHRLVTTRKDLSNVWKEEKQRRVGRE